MFLDNKYTKWYYNIINRATITPYITNGENHHIIPNSFFIKPTGRSKPGWLEGDPNHPDNLVKLSIREHRLCHLLLIKMTTGIAKKKMLLAAKLILETRETRYGLSKGKMYELIKLQWIENHKKTEVSKETKAKISTALKGKKHTEEHRKNNKQAQLKREPCSEETRQKLKQSMIGRVFTEEWKENQRKAWLTRLPITEETREKMRLAAANRKPASDETRKKISEAGKKRTQSPESIEKMLKTRRERRALKKLLD